MITLKQNDTGIGLKATLTNVDENVDLTDADVLFLFGGHEIVADVEDAENGKLFIAFNKVHTTKTGFYNAEFEVKFKDNRVETFPNDGYIKIQIKQDLGGTS